MGHYHNPQVVMNGLILYLDPANPRSYAGTGTFFNDLSLIGNNAYLFNSPTFSSSNSGSFSFDGVNDTIYTSNSYSNPNPFSICVYFRTSSASGKKIMGFESTQNETSGSYDRHLYVNTAGQLVFGLYPGSFRYLNSESTVTDNTWRYAVGTVSGSAANLYINGIGLSSASNYGAENYTGYWRVGSNRLDSWALANTGSFLGDIGLVKIYNRALTETEIIKNFNATKKRYGL